ncbi:hypothetical protein L7F22_045984 [Adiantum nelumboides]|nr:hypothetical protein [Adiantum nelumboides]
MPDLVAAENFEKQQLGKVASQAMAGALLHKITACVGAATLTWATVVVMGGFASAVPIPDFIQVTFLVIFICCSLGLALLSSKLVTRKSLYRGSLDPVSLCYDDKRLKIVIFYQFISIVVQLAFILPSASIAISSLKRPEFEDIKIVTLLQSALQHAPVANGGDESSSVVSDLQACLHKCASSSASNNTISSIASCVRLCYPKPSATIDNLQVALYIFFLLVVGTCGSALSCVLYITTECARLWPKKQELSLKKYHDEVMSRALHVSFVEADEFDVKDFFLRGLGEDLAIRNIAPLEVMWQNSELINYLYNHPKGVEMVNEWLVSDNSMRQQTAANLVGFWARRHNLEKNTSMLCKLAEKLGLPGKTAEAAANGLGALAAKQWRGRENSPLLNIKVTCDDGNLRNVVEKVLYLILEKRLSTLQVYVRLLGHLFMSHSVLTSLTPQKHKQVKAKLLSIASREEHVQRGQPVNGVRIDPSIRARTGFYAFSALARLMGFQNASMGTVSSSNSRQTTNHTNRTNPGGVIDDAPTRSGNSDHNSHATTNYANPDVVDNTFTGSANDDRNSHETTHHANSICVIDKAPTGSANNDQTSDVTTNHPNPDGVTHNDPTGSAINDRNFDATTNQANPDGFIDNAPTECAYNDNNTDVTSNHSHPDDVTETPPTGSSKDINLHVTINHANSDDIFDVHKSDVTAKNAIPDGIIDNVSISSANSDCNSHETTNHTNADGVIDDAHTSHSTNNDLYNNDVRALSNSTDGNSHNPSSSGSNEDNWHTLARTLLSRLDTQLQHQEFMWYLDAVRYRELCRMFFPDGEDNIGAWLENCEIRGQKLPDHPEFLTLQSKVESLQAQLQTEREMTDESMTQLMQKVSELEREKGKALLDAKHAREKIRALEEVLHDDHVWKDVNYDVDESIRLEDPENFELPFELYCDIMDEERTSHLERIAIMDDSVKSMRKGIDKYKQIVLGNQVRSMSKQLHENLVDMLKFNSDYNRISKMTKQTTKWAIDGSSFSSTLDTGLELDVRGTSKRGCQSRCGHCSAGRHTIKMCPSREKMVVKSIKAKKHLSSTPQWSTELKQVRQNYFQQEKFDNGSLGFNGIVRSQRRGEVHPIQEKVLDIYMVEIADWGDPDMSIGRYAGTRESADRSTKVIVPKDTQPVVPKKDVADLKGMDFFLDGELAMDLQAILELYKDAIDGA